MKKILKSLTIVLMLTAILPLMSAAQRPMYRQQQLQLQQQQQKQYNRQSSQLQNQKEQMEAQRIAFITRQLQLTPAEAKVFWPVYNEYDAKRKELRKNFKDSNNMQMADIDKLSDQDAVKMLDNQIIEAQKLLDLRKEYHSQFKSVIPPTKVLKLYAAERDFQKMLIERLRQNRQKPQQ